MSFKSNHFVFLNKVLKENFFGLRKSGPYKNGRRSRPTPILEVAIMAIEISHNRGWNAIWLECDSSLAFRNAAKRGVDNSNSITYECTKKRSISNIPGHTQRNIQARDELKRSINWYCSDLSLKSYSESATQKQNIPQFDTYLHTFIMNLNIA
ncbi:hypothetical protein Lal_00031379 [Lupinus albus]|nr:hypothetical protein Lal_00031379 [Lupinus albus]